MLAVYSLSSFPCAEAEFGPWSKWTLCSKSCEGGVRYRSRKCFVKSEGGAGGEVLADADGSHRLFCTGERLQSMPCFTNISCGKLPWNL